MASLDNHIKTQYITLIYIAVVGVVAYVMACDVYNHTHYGVGRGEWGEAQYIHTFLLINTQAIYCARPSHNPLRHAVNILRDAVYPLRGMWSHHRPPRRIWPPAPPALGYSQATAQSICCGPVCAQAISFAVLRRGFV